jgi:uncharacterized membrane protein
MQTQSQDGPGGPPKEASSISAHSRKWLATASDTSLRSLIKAVSWRILGSIDTTLLALLFTRNLTISMAIGGTEIITKVLLYYLHERLWTRIAFGKT